MNTQQKTAQGLLAVVVMTLLVSLPMLAQDKAALMTKGATVYKAYCPKKKSSAALSTA
jgi:hypothetical protein